MQRTDDEDPLAQLRHKIVRGVQLHHRDVVAKFAEGACQEYGQPFYTNKDGRVMGINERYWAALYARENQVPTLGLCLGLQCMVIEAARNLAVTVARDPQPQVDIRSDNFTKYAVIHEVVQF